MAGRFEVTALRAATAAVLVASLMVVIGGGSQASAATSCPDFTILHNDKIGKLDLPHGRYAVTVTSGNLTCRDTTRLLQRFLQQGNVSDGWRVDAGTSTFSKRSQAFRIKPDGSGGGGGGGGGGHGGRTVCPGTFRVLNNDRIGQLRIPAGNYRITTRRMSCESASDKFRRFLQFPRGNLPDNWRVRPLRAKFRNPETRQSFRIKRVSS